MVAQPGLHLVEAALELRLADLADGGQHAQDVEEAAGEVAAPQRPNGVALRQGRDDGGRDERSREERVGVDRIVAVHGARARVCV